MMGNDLMKALAGEFNPKFLATVSSEGQPNVVPVITLQAEDDKTLIFAELMIWKTKKNIESNPNVCISVISEDLKHWTIHGIFEGFETMGKRFERITMMDMFRYNAYTGPRSAGVIRVKKVEPHGKLLKAVRVLEFAGMHITGMGLGGGRMESDKGMPIQVSEKFGRLKAGKCIAWTDEEGKPVCENRFGIVPVGNKRLLIGNGDLKPKRKIGIPAAACVISMDPVAYQVKGTMKSFPFLGNALLMEVDEVYSASPPVPGKRIS